MFVVCSIKSSLAGTTDLLALDLVLLGKAFFGVLLGVVDEVGVCFVALFGVFLELAPCRDPLGKFGVLAFSDFGVFS